MDEARDRSRGGCRIWRQKLLQISGMSPARRTASSSISSVRPTGWVAPPPEISTTRSPTASCRRARLLRLITPLLRRRALVALPVAELGAADHPHPHHLRALRHLARILAPLAAELVDDDLLERRLGPAFRQLPFAASDLPIGDGARHEPPWTTRGRGGSASLVSSSITDASSATALSSSAIASAASSSGSGSSSSSDSSLQPLEAVDLEVAGPHLGDRERAPAVLPRVAGRAPGAAVGIEPVAGLEGGEVGMGQRAVLLGDPRHVGARVVDPDRLRRRPLGEEDDVGLGAGAVRREGAVGQAQHGVQVAVLGEHLEHLAGLVGEQAVVGHDHRGAAAGFQQRHDVLQEVELLVRGLDRQVVALRRLVRPLVAERRIGQHHVEAPVAAGCS